MAELLFLAGAFEDVSTCFKRTAAILRRQLKL